MRGLTSLSKQQQLARDMLTDRVDFCSVQELKIKDIPLGLSHRLVELAQSSGRHGGIGFVMSNQLIKFISKFKKLSDRVAYVIILIPQPGACSTLPVRFVIAYGPTNPLAQSNPTIS